MNEIKSLEDRIRVTADEVLWKEIEKAFAPAADYTFRIMNTGLYNDKGEELGAHNVMHALKLSAFNAIQPDRQKKAIRDFFDKVQNL